jgi:hypothetical protein
MVARVGMGVSCAGDDDRASPLSITRSAGLDRGRGGGYTGGMLRALVVLLLVVVGTAAVAHGLDIRRQLRTQLEEGVGGVLRSAYVAHSPGERERVANYRWWSWMLIGGGCGALALAVGGGMLGGGKVEKPAGKSGRAKVVKGKGRK